MLQAVTKRLTKGMAPDGSPDSPPQSSDEHNNSSDIENAVAPDSNHKKEDGVNQSIHSTRDEEVISDEKQEFREAWRDLRVLFSGNGDSGKSQQDVGSGSREYLAGTF